MVGWYGSDDPCAICVHEHENWGNNEHCKKCKDKYNNATGERKSEKEAKNGIKI